jgi:hypothetical protein
MANNKALYIIITVFILVVLGVGAFLFLSNRGAEEKADLNQLADDSLSTETEEEKMVNCGETDDPMCFINRMNGCLPVTIKMMGSDGETSIEMTILGIENEKCHFERKLNDVLDMNCYFPKGTLNMNTLDQMFGNDKGLQQVVDDACESGW